ncbi:hypothetical protein ACOSP7_011515 [Xanthoceras sorbifolium]
MANSRITRFVMEVAPPQFVSVMRHRSRTAKMLDTISEEERDVDFDGCFSKYVFELRCWLITELDLLKFFEKCV